jgi:hypothetical protein
VLWSGILLAARDADRPPPFAVLPAMVLWANLHGSFLFGLALAVFLAADAVWQARPGLRRAAVLGWGGFVAAAILCALLTPHGLAGIEQPLRLVLMPELQTSFKEWLSPDFQQSPALEMWILGIVLIGFASGIRLPPTRLVLLLGLLHMSLQHVRHADLLAIVGPLALAAPLGRGLALLTAARPSGLESWFARWARPAGIPAMAVATVIAVALALPAAVNPIARGNDAVTPATALTLGQRLGLSGPVLNSEVFGGYLVFRGLPVFFDGRIEMYGADILARAAAAERGDASALVELLSRYRIGWTLLVPSSGAVAVMDGLSGWQRVYADDYAIIHRRSDPAR